MLPPLIRLFVDQPGLLADHAEAWCALVGDELGRAGSAWRRQALLLLVALALGGSALVLAGVAVLLWASVPGLAAGPALVLVPLLPAVLALLCVLATRIEPVRPGFGALRAQLAADAQLLRDGARP